MKKYGIVAVSHVEEVAYGVTRLLAEIAPDTSITYAGGTEDGRVGTSFEKILAAFETNEADEILAFYDLGSAKMNLEIAIEMTEKTVHLYDAAFIEGLYTATALVNADVNLEGIEEQLDALIVK